jgi:hypothetical protein
MKFRNLLSIKQLIVNSIEYTKFIADINVNFSQYN